MASAADVLIVDDDRDLVTSMRIVLESQGYRVRSAYNGREGLLRIEEKTPEVIILDVMMATDTEGFDLAFKLKNHPVFGRIPIVMLTSFPKKMAEMGPEPFQHILGEEWPVSQFIEKPIDPEALLSVIAEVLKENRSS